MKPGRNPWYVWATLMLLLSLAGCGQPKNQRTMVHKDRPGQKPNQLIHETSPYLRQHAYNPVDWHAWNPETLEKAKRENKMLLISIGYAACHWCHVMERESFEDSVVAVKMNANYIPVKIDREERPDIDQIYMAAAMLITGQGGWPLNAVALPDGHPVYAGTYYPRDRWIALLDHFSQLYANDRGRLEEQARRVTEGIRGMEEVAFREDRPDYGMADLDSIWNRWEPRLDVRYGGRKGAPKFMMPNNYDFLMRYYELSGNDRVLRAIHTGLTAMARGGLYDQVGGGFARYAVDDRWMVPHFEKMLYDNAQLVSIYAQAWQLTGNETYRRVVYETLAFTDRELSDAGGGFYASLDADSEGEEGKFYVWSREELDRVLGADAAMIADYFQVTEAGNWEPGKNILHLNIDSEDYQYAEKYGLSPEAWRQKVESARARLLRARANRTRPGLDDKILTSWTALMLKGYVDAYRAFGEEAWLARALEGARFLYKRCLREDGGLNRNYKDGRSTINGFLDDYSFTIEAFLALYQATFDPTWLDRANSLTEYVLEHFSDSSNGMFFYTNDLDDALIARKQEVQDNVISASNSSMARVLYYLGHYFYNDAYLDRAQTMLGNVAPQVLESGPFYANWACLMTQFVKPVFEVAIAGSRAQALRAEMDRQYLPHVLFLGGAEPGKLELLQDKFIRGETIIYVCQNKACRLPVRKAEDAISIIKN